MEQNKVISISSLEHSQAECIISILRGKPSGQLPQEVEIMNNSFSNGEKYRCSIQLEQAMRGKLKKSECGVVLEYIFTPTQLESLYNGGRLVCHQNPAP